MGSPLVRIETALVASSIGCRVQGAARRLIGFEFVIALSLQVSRYKCMFLKLAIYMS